jgi:polyisoprenoid-binding protein YceI
MTTTTTTTTTPTTRTYDIDKAHSEVTFQVRHLVTRVRGRFSDFSGQIEFDTANPTQSSVRFTIDAKSIDTNTVDRDNHLRSEDFFYAEKFPTLTFESTSITARGDNEYEVHGSLTIRGVSKKIALPVTFLGEAKDPWGGARIGFEAGITINRKDYGLMWNAALETGGFLVGDDVKISLMIQAIGK